MDQKGILEILRFVNKSNLTEVEIEELEFKLRIRKGTEDNIIYSSVPVGQPVQQMTGMPMAQPSLDAPAPVAPVPATNEDNLDAAPESKDSGNIVEFKSPMIGTFYRSSSPDKEPYIKVGDYISKGQVLCIVEAMKLFNEIEFEGEKEAKIVKILVENAVPVEYDTPLFLIEFE